MDACAKAYNSHLDTQMVVLCVLQVNFGAAAAAVFTAAFLVASPVFAAEGDVKVRGLLQQQPSSTSVILVQLVCQHNTCAPCASTESVMFCVGLPRLL